MAKHRAYSKYLISRPCFSLANGIITACKSSQDSTNQLALPSSGWRGVRQLVETPADLGSFSVSEDLVVISNENGLDT